MYCPPARTERIKRSLDKTHASAERAKMLQRAARPAEVEVTQIGGNIVHIAIAKINEFSELVLRTVRSFSSFYACILYSASATLFCGFGWRQVGCSDVATKGCKGCGERFGVDSEPTPLNGLSQYTPFSQRL